MSNTGQIKRYEVYGDSVKDRYLNDDGEFVKYDDHLNIVNDLEIRIAELERVIRNVTLIAEYPPKDRAILDELSKLTAKD